MANLWNDYDVIETSQTPEYLSLLEKTRKLLVNRRKPMSVREIKVKLNLISENGRDKQAAFYLADVLKDLKGEIFTDESNVNITRYSRKVGEERVEPKGIWNGQIKVIDTPFANYL